MHSADVRASLDDVVDIVLKSGFVDNEYDTGAKALVMHFVAADLPLKHAGKRVEAGDLRAEIVVDHLLQETSRFGMSLEHRVVFLRAVQAAVIGSLRGQRDAAAVLRAEVDRLVMDRWFTASPLKAIASSTALADVDGVNEGDL